MADLIKVENGIAILEPETVAKISAFERSLKRIKAQEDELKALILQEMEAKGILKIEAQEEGLTISYVPSYDRESFNSKKFQEEQPDLFDEYVKLTPIKSSVRVSVK